MKRLSDVISLGQWCRGGCGLSPWRHRRGEVFVGVLHFADRRMTKAGAKNLLMLAARRERTNDDFWLNTPEWAWFYEYRDAVRAQDLAGQFGFRLPSHLFDRERARCRALAAEQGIRLSRREKVRAWLRG